MDVGRTIPDGRKSEKYQKSVLGKAPTIYGIRIGVEASGLLADLSHLFVQGYFDNGSSAGRMIVWWITGTTTEAMIMNMDETVENRFTAIRDGISMIPAVTRDSFLSTEELIDFRS